jgi:hypothetical protein
VRHWAGVLALAPTAGTRRTPSLPWLSGPCHHSVHRAVVPGCTCHPRLCACIHRRCSTLSPIIPLWFACLFQQCFPAVFVCSFEPLLCHVLLCLVQVPAFLGASDSPQVSHTASPPPPTHTHIAKSVWCCALNPYPAFGMVCPGRLDQLAAHSTSLQTAGYIVDASCGGMA